MWEELATSLSLAGLCPLGDKVTSVSISGDILKVIVCNSKMAKYKFSKLHLFDDYSISGLPPALPFISPKLRVFDWFDVRTGMEHQHDILHSPDDFIKEIIFYPSSRFGAQSGERTRKDLVAISHLEPAQLGDFQYSDTMARFKVLHMMKEVGIRGARNGRDPQNPAVYKYYSPKIEAMERQIEPFPQTSYEFDPRFEWPLRSPAQILQDHTLPTKTYAAKMLKMIQNSS